jgi:hypothetical protein
LTKPRAVAEQWARQRFELKIKCDLFARCGFLRRIRSRVDELFRIDRRQLQAQIARQQPPRVDDFVDQGELLFCLTDNRFTRPYRSGFVKRLPLDELCPTKDAVERTAQVVGDHAEVIVRKSVDLD